VWPSFRSKFDPLIEELRYRQQLRGDTAAALTAGDAQEVEHDDASEIDSQQHQQQQQQQQRSVGEEVAAAAPQQQQGEATEDLADVICSAAFDRVLSEVLSDAVDMYNRSGWQQQQQALAPAAMQPHLQQQQEASAATGVTAASASSADTADTADSSSGSKSIQLDWQSSPGSPPPHFSPMTMRAAAAAAASAAAAETSAAEPSISPAIAGSPASLAAAAEGAVDGAQQQQQWQLVSHPPTDWTPLSDEVATPWSLEAAASSRYGAGSSLTATDHTAAVAAAAGGSDLELGLGGTVRQLDMLLSQAATEGEAAAAAAAESVEFQQQLQQEPELLDLAKAAAGADDNAASAATSFAADSCESEGDAAAADAAAGLPLSSARVADGSESGSAAADEDGEFDWPETEQVRAEC
jgi:hypothetical protein